MGTKQGVVFHWPPLGYPSVLCWMGYHDWKKKWEEKAGYIPAFSKKGKIKAKFKVTYDSQYFECARCGERQ